ncbi:heat shock protein 82 [Reticulomyxa filosa]|uniref:Heat shock protein 82 n=1 Tax=Reticulomyxa filosa TaxID=46433 RepID=X6M718_RETFI|nr:heat shock protein 82 [Reticulomyxa filosa]|eukprot:ETO08815.1 heat shock protein 82 [Reticulomyxa filosa]
MPKNAPFEPMRKEKNIKLFVPRVFIMDNCKNLCTKYLSFIRCVADSEDLTSNLSIESLQQNKIVNVIQKNVVNKCLELFGEITENKADFKVLYDQFRKSRKLRINEYSKNLNKLSDLLISSEEIKSLEGYVSKMKENQKHIYITGESRANVEVSPFLEALKKIDFEVLLLVDHIDEYEVQLREYDGNKLKQDENVAYESPTKKMKEILVDKIEKVIVSYLMVDQMCFLVTGEYGLSAYGNNYECSKKFATGPFDKTIKDLVWLLFETTLLTSGSSLEEPVKFAGCIHKLIKFVSAFLATMMSLKKKIHQKMHQKDKQHTNQTLQQKTPTWKRKKSRQLKKLINLCCMKEMCCLICFTIVLFFNFYFKLDFFEMNTFIYSASNTYFLVKKVHNIIYFRQPLIHKKN